MLVPLMGAAWTLENVADCTPGGNIGTRGDAVPNSDWQVEIQYIVTGSSPQTLTTHTGQTAYMGVNWNSDFDPSVDYDPPSAWPVTGGNTNKSMQAKLTAGTTILSKPFECNTAP